MTLISAWDVPKPLHPVTSCIVLEVFLADWRFLKLFTASRGLFTAYIQRYITRTVPNRSDDERPHGS